jgi:integrase
LKYHKNVNEIYIEDIKIEDVREIKELLLLLPKNHNKKFITLYLKDLMTRCKMVDTENHDSMSVSEIKKIKEKISLNTITDKYASTMKSFWRWLNGQEYIDNDVFHVLNFNFKKKVNSWKSFTTNDLNKLFYDQIFIESDYEYPYQYFSPIIALYTSCRLQEICQLRVKDIVEIDGVDVIKVSGDNENSLKTSDSERFIPIHRDLISCGFMDYVNKLRQNNDIYLFSDLKSNDSTTNSKRVSKWFNERYKIRKEVEKGTSFHSFRRTFINEMSRNGALDYQIRDIIGHKPDRSDTLNNHYKDGLTVLEKWKLINQCIRYESCTFPWR